MSIIVFSGPTLSPQEARPILQADYRPPAKQGDIYLATLERPTIIVLIDGYFESVPAVWHKEILYAMSEGIHVYGCASMGALRAAELAHFGMNGFGSVFELYQQQVLEDDDEVALVHGPAALGYPAASEPMVNIRATLNNAVTREVITPDTASQLIILLKQLWYPDRSYARLLACAEPLLDPLAWQQLKQLTESETIDVKKQDARQLLAQLALIPDPAQLPAKQVTYHFSPTDAWERLTAELNHKRKMQQHAFSAAELWRELKLDGCFYQRRQQALCRKSTLRAAQRYHPVLEGSPKQTALLELACQQSACCGGEVDFNQLSQWLQTQQIGLSEFDTLVHQQALFTWLYQIDHQIEEEMLDILKLEQSFADYHARILSKQEAPAASLSALGLNEKELWQWFFTVRHSQHHQQTHHQYNQDSPQNTNSISPEQNNRDSPENCWAAFGFASQEEMKAAVLQDYQYHHCRKS
ncbi:TfuA-like protein [Vibrio aerogenes CECT 7868]|uniref:TfuA-like protein n=1 Tax=Vibrio aerogenes CECT 7868 TaxID=1216006 RepID=A0A1M5Y0Z0_9VIBR|nr:TfuA-like protein [Vibrio aerogenes]SHI05735.1 TfuA-like protein [Vibrio aerogenes CECT 7868]